MEVKGHLFLCVVYKVKIIPKSPLCMDLFSLQMVRVTERTWKGGYWGFTRPSGKNLLNQTSHWDFDKNQCNAVTWHQWEGTLTGSQELPASLLMTNTRICGARKGGQAGRQDAQLLIPLLRLVWPGITHWLPWVCFLIGFMRLIIPMPQNCWGRHKRMR